MSVDLPLLLMPRIARSLWSFNRSSIFPIYSLRVIPISSPGTLPDIHHGFLSIMLLSFIITSILVINYIILAVMLVIYVKKISVYCYYIPFQRFCISPSCTLFLSKVQSLYFFDDKAFDKQYVSI